MGQLKGKSAIARLRKFTPPERIKELFEYNQETGIVIRKTKRAQFSAGSIVGTDHISGYLAARVDGNIYLLHRLIWCIAYGKWPDYYIDHIDGNKQNNILVNLREANHSENTQNAKTRKDNTTGIKGIHIKENGNYVARVQYNNKRIYLGEFESLEKASSCVEKNRLLLHEDFTNNGSYNKGHSE